MLKRSKTSTGDRTTSAQRKHVVPGSREFNAQRKEDALALAQLAYDMFVEQEAVDEQIEAKSPHHSRDSRRLQ